MNTAVKFFQSTQTGAPTLAGQANSLIAVLNACLLNGFNLKTITSLMRNGTTVTATVNGHGYREGDVVWIAGAEQSAYNGEQRIRNLTTNSFEFEVSGEPTSPASGTLTVKLAPLGWESPFSSATKAVYRALAPSSRRLYLRIDETSISGDVNYGRGLRSAYAQMFEAMTDVDSGTGMSQVIWRKAQNETTTARPWVLIGDSQRFWLLVNWSESYLNRFVPYFFGDFVSFKAADAYGALLGGYYDWISNSSVPQSYQLLSTLYAAGSPPAGNTGILLPRSHTQLGGTIQASYTQGFGYQNSSLSSAMGDTYLPYPNPTDNGLYLTPVLLQENAAINLRGRLPGIYAPLHRITASEPVRYQGFTIDGSVRDVLVMPGPYGTDRLAIDITGPWA